MRYRYPAPRLMRRIDIVIDSDLTNVPAATVAEPTEPHGIPAGRGTIATETASVPDVCREESALRWGWRWARVVT